MPERSRALPLLAVLAVASCTGRGDLAIDPGYVAVHNAMRAMGVEQTGSISRGHLESGREATTNVMLDGASCYHFLAVGGDGLADVGVEIVTSTGATLARDTTEDRYASAHVCPEAPESARFVVRAQHGSGPFASTYWSVARRELPPPAGTCASPFEARLERGYDGTTVGGGSDLAGSCGGTDSPETVYRLLVDHRTLVELSLEAQFEAAIYLRSSCDDAPREIAAACMPEPNDERPTRLTRVLEPGTYYVVVDGVDGAFGAYRLRATASDPRPVARACEAVALHPGERTPTDDAQNVLLTHATCDPSGDLETHVMRLDLSAGGRSRVRIATPMRGVLSLRSECSASASELACEMPSLNGTTIAGVLDPREYWVLYSGSTSADSGPPLSVERAPAAGGESPELLGGDRCDEPNVPFARPGPTARVDTFYAHDDTAASCGGGGAPDLVRRVQVTARSRLLARVTAPAFDGVLSLRRECGDASTELADACRTFGRSGGRLDAVVDPGTYWIVIDGASDTAFGTAALEVQLAPAEERARACRDAPRLVPGRGVVDDTTGHPNRFEAACARGARSPDAVYRLEIDRRSDVQLLAAARADGYDIAMHLWSLGAEGTEPTALACNDDAVDFMHSFIEQRLERGTYCVVVDGFDERNAGRFRLDAIVEPLP